MTLRELAQSIPSEFNPIVVGPGATSFESLSYDSRQVFSGVLFVCLVGEKSDGHKFANEAVKRGAVALIIDSDHSYDFLSDALPHIVVTNTRKALPFLSAAFYEDPSTKFELIGITGTNGKTTASYMVASIWQQAGDKSGVVGTVGAVVDGTTFPTHWTVSTTPESLDLQQFFSQMRDEHVKHVAIEVTSIAIDQERTAALDFDTVIFTNLTQDHLDYHGTMEAYEAAKTRLFVGYPSSLKPGFIAVLNIDDLAGSRLALRCAAARTRSITYGIKYSNADHSAINIVSKADKTYFTVVEKSGAEYPITLPIGGLFNVYNALSAIAATRARGVDIADVQEGLGTLKPVPGRFEPVPAPGKEFHVLVDYAHTPDGLENVLLSARALNPSRVIVVFGCGGDRDRMKRPKMGRIAADLADVVLITSDNPRTENPDFIVSEIATGIEGVEADARIQIVVDRREAIRTAICDLARPGDLIVIAGKGHETYQIVGNQTFPFDDRLVAAEVLRQC
jgi:UDP-N-acetylmuramoyl-L-alanyl-D-glutamate--2,6-diaminopimelate ligase